MILQRIQEGDVKSIARGISLIENEVTGYQDLLQSLPASNKKIIGITGPPGAGKSTLVDALIMELVKDNQSVAVLCVDPSSPFNLGALLGDRIRMSQWYNNPKVYIRSLATRGALGGLHPKIIEISDLLRAAPFDQIIIETVGVGQSEIEIAGLADTTVLVVVPESGDDIQVMKAGIMEIADLFVVNKADRPSADLFAKNLLLMLTPAYNPESRPVSVVKTIASKQVGVQELLEKIKDHHQFTKASDKKFRLFAEKAFYLIQQKLMENVNKKDLLEKIMGEVHEGTFNLYRFVHDYLKVNPA